MKDVLVKTLLEGNKNQIFDFPGADFTKGLSPDLDLNLRLLS